MLAVFQEVAKSVRDEKVGRLATFDHMYDGIAASLRGDMQTSIKLAERQLGEMQLRILKSLFLLKWVREFKATPRNIAILLIDRPDLDIRAHELAVKEALAAAGEPVLPPAEWRRVRVPDRRGKGHRSRDQEYGS